MIAGLHGSLLSHDALLRAAPHRLGVAPGGAERDRALRRLRALMTAAYAELGPASPPRAIFDRIAAPLALALGYHVLPASSAHGGHLHGWLCAADGSPIAAMLVTAWGVDAGGAWREAVRHGIAGGLRWCFCVTGGSLRLIDAARTWSRRYAEFDLATAADNPATFAVLWNLLHADAVRGRRDSSALDLALRMSERHRADVRSSLQHGVHQALEHLALAFVTAAGRRRARALQAGAIFDESLIVVYRILFLLFAEARGLVPRWHPVYRDSYTIEALRGSLETRSRARGIWESLQAIARLAHRGCHAGALRVPPFNGRLFSPSHAPLADALPLDDGAVREALLALTTVAGPSGAQRITYADLGVEQLGGVYERVLDFEPAIALRPRPSVTFVRAERRKATGSFYTPRSLTEYLVRRTLGPLVEHATPEQILGLRVLDPAMGSGAFLVAACRYLASAYETAMVRDGGLTPGDMTPAERAAFRRTIAQRCLYGVDINPMAVQLGRLSLWLATLASDRPLTFLDHHLRAGNSLLGASLLDIVRRPFAGPRSRTAPLPLFDDEALDEAMEATVTPRLAIANQPGDTLEQVREKERLLHRIDRGGPLARWKQVADLWCAPWFPGGEAGSVPQMRAAQRAGVFSALADALLGREAILPEHVAKPLLDEVSAAAARERFFHWTLEFPEVFYTPAGAPLAAPGFDAIVGNPPWEMLRGDRGSVEARRQSGAAASRLTDFARGSGVYGLQGTGHANLYQLFLERALSLVRDGGRVGLVLPSGVGTDHGCAALRRHLFDRTRVDTMIGVENRDGIFPIHRGLKFLLLTTTLGGRTDPLSLRCGVRSADVFDELSDVGADPQAVAVPRELLERVSGPQLAVPELRTPIDAAIVSRLTLDFPALGGAAGWNVRFGRELNATDDRRHFSEDGRGLPVVEGKHIAPFAVDLGAVRQTIPRAVAARLLRAERTFGRPRLAYRDVAASTNKLTLIAAVVPAGVVTTHTLFCLKDDLDSDAQQFLCGVFNSLVANYLVRLRVSTHVTVAIIERLAVPVVSTESAEFREIAELASALAQRPDDVEGYVRLQVAVARLYRLADIELQHILGTFPLVDASCRAAVLAAFRRSNAEGAERAEAAERSR